MPLIYFHNPLGAFIFLISIIIGVLGLIIWLLFTFGIGKSRKSDDEKVNPVTFALDNKNHEKDE